MSDLTNDAIDEEAVVGKETAERLAEVGRQFAEARQQLKADAYEAAYGAWEVDDALDFLEALRIAQRIFHKSRRAGVHARPTVTDANDTTTTLPPLEQWQHSDLRQYETAVGPWTIRLYKGSTLLYDGEWIWHIEHPGYPVEWHKGRAPERERLWRHGCAVYSPRS